MKTSKVLINILIVLLVLIALWLGFMWFTGGDDSGALPTVSVSRQDSEVGTSEGGSQFVVLFRQLRNVNFDETATSFLADPIFTTELRDYSVPLTDAPAGRQNPFAPFGVGDTTSGTGVSTDFSSVEGPEDTPDLSEEDFLVE